MPGSNIPEVREMTIEEWAEASVVYEVLLRDIQESPDAFHACLSVETVQRLLDRCNSVVSNAAYLEAIYDNSPSSRVIDCDDDQSGELG